MKFKSLFVVLVASIGAGCGAHTDTGGGAAAALVNVTRVTLHGKEAPDIEWFNVPRITPSASSASAGHLSQAVLSYYHSSGCSTSEFIGYQNAACTSSNVLCIVYAGMGATDTLDLSVIPYPNAMGTLFWAGRLNGFESGTVGHGYVRDTITPAQQFFPASSGCTSAGVTADEVELTG